MRRATLVVLVLLAGCGDDDDPAATTTTEATTTTTSTSTSTTSTTTSTSTTTLPEQDHDEGIGDLEVALAELLVRADELGEPALGDQGYSPEAEPCIDGDDGEPSVLVGVSLSGDGRAVRQELRAYETLDQAAAATTAMRGGSACGPPVDETARIGGDEAFTRTVEDGTFVAARVTDVVVTFRVSGTFDPIEVTAFGVGKLLALLEQSG